jgi:hypothetical protein
MSPIGTSRHFAAPQQFGRFLSKADINSGGPQSQTSLVKYTLSRPLLAPWRITMGLSKLSWTTRVPSVLV